MSIDQVEKYLAFADFGAKPINKSWESFMMESKQDRVLLMLAELLRGVAMVARKRGLTLADVVERAIAHAVDERDARRATETRTP